MVGTLPPSLVELRRTSRFALPTRSLRRVAHLQHAAANLILLDRFEQRLEIALAESIVALALDEFEEDRPDRVRRENLQQHFGVAAIDHALAVDQDAVALQAGDVLAMPRQARVDLLEIGLWRRRHERQAVGAQRLDGGVDVARAAGDVLDALTAIDVEILLDLPGIAGVLVDRNPDLAVRTGQRARKQAGRATFDVEETDLAKIEQLFVEAGPHIHAAAMDVVGEVVDVIKPGAGGTRVPGAKPFELDVVGRSLGAVTIDEIEHTAADALDGGNIERLLRGRNIGGLCTQRERPLIGLLRIDHAKRHRRRAWPVRRDEAMAMGAGLFVDEIIDIALAIDRDLFGLVAGDRQVAHQLEQRVQLLRLWVGILDEFET